MKAVLPEFFAESMRMALRLWAENRAAELRAYLDRTYPQPTEPEPESRRPVGPLWDA